MGNNVLLIGLDAACFEQLDPLVSESVVPTIADLIEDGAAADMPTTTPPWTPSAWPSITTGTAPWTHGIYDFHHYDADGTVGYVSANEVRVPFLWEILSAAGHASIVVNVPVTHPVHYFSGSLVPGYIAPEDTPCLVDGSPGAIDSLVPGYRIYTRTGRNRDARIADYEELIASRAEVTSALADRHEWSFTMVQFQSTDGVFHMFGDDGEAIRRVFGAVDTAIETLIDDLDPDWTLVVSDHGIHRYERVFHANTWLRDRGYVETTASSERRAWNARTVAERKGADEVDAGTRTVRRLLDALARIGVTPGRVDTVLSAVGATDFLSRILPDDVLLDVADAADHVDWEASAAFCRSSASMGLRCNVVGRDPGGVVPPTQFDDFRTELVTFLRAVKAPDGTPVFERVYDRHQVHGSDVANERSAPDVVFRPTNMTYKVSDVIRGRTITTTDKYNHKYEGLFLAEGPGIDPRAAVSPVVTDVAPTVLGLLGIDPPDWMEGRRLESVRPPERAAAPTPEVPHREYVDDSRAGEAVGKRLRELGYVE
jgi:predicted AlkP superfamily phosphohydrolase/phosphomutase